MRIRIRANNPAYLLECFDCHETWRTRQPIWTQICPQCHSHNVEKMA